MKSQILSLALILLTVNVDIASPPRATLQGTVRDGVGAVLPGATIQVQRWDRDKKGWHTVIVTDPPITADKDGKFSIYLPPGLYDVFISHPLMRPFSEKVRIEPNRILTLDSQLQFSPLLDWVD